MTAINGKVCVVNGVPVDKVFRDGRQVYGRNLYIDTKNFDNPSVWYNYNLWPKTGEKFNGLAVLGKPDDWNGLGQNIQTKKGETYTFSVYARYESGTGNPNMYFSTPYSYITDNDSMKVPLNETWQRITGTFTMTADGPIRPRIERAGDNTSTLLIAGPKLEKGSIATPHSIAPEDVLKNYIAAPKNLTATVIDKKTEKLAWE